MEPLVRGVFGQLFFRTDSVHILTRAAHQTRCGLRRRFSSEITSSAGGWIALSLHTTDTSFSPDATSGVSGGSRGPRDVGDPGAQGAQGPKGPKGSWEPTFNPQTKHPKKAYETTMTIPSLNFEILGGVTHPLKPNPGSAPEASVVFSAHPPPTSEPPKPLHGSGAAGKLAKAAGCELQIHRSSVTLLPDPAPSKPTPLQIPSSPLQIHQTTRTTASP